MPDTTVSVIAKDVGSSRTFGQMKDHITFGHAVLGSSPTQGKGKFTLGSRRDGP